MVIGCTFISDPGHGWLEVAADVARRVLGEKIKLISNYSYVFDNLIYLEEDCDAPLFLNECKAKGLTCDVEETSLDWDSQIRNYRRFEA